MSELVAAKVGRWDWLNRGGGVKSGQIEGLFDQARRLDSESGIKTLFAFSGATALGGGLKGQVDMMRHLNDASGGSVREFLVTDEDFEERNRNVLAEGIFALLADGLTPILNRHYEARAGSMVDNNDSVLADSTRALSKYLGLPLRAHVVFTEIGGLYQPDGTLVRSVDKVSHGTSRGHIDTSSSPDGLQGMLPKFDSVWEVVDGGYTKTGVITSLSVPDSLIGAVRGDVDGTIFHKDRLGSTALTAPI